MAVAAAVGTTEGKGEGGRQQPFGIIGKKSGGARVRVCRTHMRGADRNMYKPTVR